MKKNIIANLLGKVWGFFSNFFFLPLYLKFLGLENFSVISLAILLAGIISVIDGGLSSTLSRELARNTTFDFKKDTLITIESIYLLIILLFTIVLYFSSGYIADNFVNIDSINFRDKINYVRILGASTLLQLLINFYIGGLLGIEKQVKANLYRILYGVLRNGVVVILIYFKPTLYVFFIWQATITFIFALLIRKSLFTNVIGENLIEFRINKEVVNKIGRFTLGIFLIMIVATINTQLDKVIIGKMMSSENLSYYTLSVTLAMAIVTLISPVSIASLPRFTYLYSINDIEKSLELFKKLFNFIIVIVLTSISMLFVFSKEILWIWTNDVSIASNSSLSLPWLCLGFGMIALQHIPFNIAVANGYTKLNNIIGIVSIFFTIPSYWLSYRYYGVEGVAFTFFLNQFLSTIVYIYMICRKFLRKIAISKLFYIQILVPFTSVFLLTFLIKHIYINSNISIERFPLFVFLLLLGGVNFFIGLFLVIPFDQIKEESKKIKNRLLKI